MAQRYKKVLIERFAIIKKYSQFPKLREFFAIRSLGETPVTALKIRKKVDSVVKPESAGLNILIIDDLARKY